MPSTGWRSAWSGSSCSTSSARRPWRPRTTHRRPCGCSHSGRRPGSCSCCSARSHAPLPENFLDRLGRGRRWLSPSVVAAVSLYEALDASAWNRFVVNTDHYTATRSQSSTERRRTPTTSASRGHSEGRGSFVPGPCSYSPLTCGFTSCWVLHSASSASPGDGGALGSARTTRDRSRPVADPDQKRDPRRADCRLARVSAGGRSQAALATQLAIVVAA